MTTEIKSNSPCLYHSDYYLWIEQTVQQLKEREFSQIDLVNLIEELEDMGRSEKRAIYSNLKIILLHLLKYKYQPSKRSKSWRASIREHRQRLKRDFRDSPSLKRYFFQVFNETYQDARKLAADETGLDINTFPSESPFTSEEILNSEYLPNS